MCPYHKFRDATKKIVRTYVSWFANGIIVKIKKLRKMKGMMPEESSSSVKDHHLTTHVATYVYTYLLYVCM